MSFGSVKVGNNASLEAEGRSLGAFVTHPGLAASTRLAPQQAQDSQCGISFGEKSVGRTIRELVDTNGAISVVVFR